MKNLKIPLAVEQQIKRLQEHNIIVEIYFRTLIANTFSLAHCTQAPFDQHYDENNYRNIQGFNNIKEHFKREREYYSDSLIIRHHQLSYGDKLPLWAIVELLSFSDLSKYYACLKDADADKIAKACGTSRKELVNHLRCLSILRNKCSHAARLYNIELNPPAMLPVKLLKMLAPNNGNSTLFAYLHVLSKRLPSKIRRENYRRSIEELIEKYENYIDLKLLGFPQDWKNLL